MMGLQDATLAPMTQGLERRYGLGGYHFVTTSCYGRQPYFASPEVRLILDLCLEVGEKFEEIGRLSFN